jgi:cytochrome c biogenesis protein CcmG/thiol:disulfide interchange protein DsbE
VKVAKVALQTAAVGLVCLLIGLLGWQVVQREKGRHLVANIHSGTRPPGLALELERLRADAGRLSLTSMRGKIVVLNFWASWCQPCKDESPLLEKTWQDNRTRGVVVLGVDAWDLRADARSFAERYKLTYPLLFDGPGSTLGRWGVGGFPHTFFVGRDGRLSATVEGPLTVESLNEGINAALAAPSS